MTTPLDEYKFPDIDSITEQHNPLHKSETIASLRHELTSQKVPKKDTVTPSNAVLFPEEYQLETDTGLVKTQTIASVKGSMGGLSTDQLNRAVQKNKKDLEKDKKTPGWWKKLRKILTIGIMD